MSYPGGVGLTSKKNWVGSQVNLFLLRVKKFRFESGIFRVRSGRKILTCFAMSSGASLAFFF